MTINREAFERAVSEKSPLTPSQVDRMFGEVTADNRALVWAFINLPARFQMAAFSFHVAFEGSTVTAVRQS